MNENNISLQDLSELMKPETLSASYLFRSKVEMCLQENLSNPQFQMQDLCIYLHMSRTCVHRKFKLFYRTNFTELLTSLRLENAKEMLVSSGLNVSQIAYRVGYNDPSYFVRTFRKVEGQTPGRFRICYSE